MTWSDFILKWSLTWNKWIGDRQTNRLVQKSEWGWKLNKEASPSFLCLLKVQMLLSPITALTPPTWFWLMLQPDLTSGKVSVLVTYLYEKHPKFQWLKRMMTILSHNSVHLLGSAWHFSAAAAAVSWCYEHLDAQMDYHTQDASRTGLHCAGPRGQLDLSFHVISETLGPTWPL